MSLDTRTFTIILAMTAAAAFCRYSGFGFMRFVPMTPRIRAGLDAIPLAVMLGIILPPALRGGVPEWCGIAVTAAVVLFRFNELIAILCGMGAVALARGFGL